MPENIEDLVLEAALADPSEAAPDVNLEEPKTLNEFFASAGAVEIPEATRQIIERAARTRVQEQRRGRQ